MSNSPEPRPPEPPRRSHLPRRLPSALLKLGVCLGAVGLISGVAVMVWGKRVINNRLLPRVEGAIADAIERPIELGDVEQWSLTGFRLGESTIPATETDASSLTVDGVWVTFGLRSLLFEQTLEPHVTLVRPDLALVKRADNQWLELGWPEPSEEEPLVSFEIQSIAVEDARLTASTALQDPEALVLAEPIAVAGVDANIEFYGEDLQYVDFEIAGDVDSGEFDINGEADIASQALKANIRTQNLPTTGVNLLLPEALGLSSRAGLGSGILNTHVTVAASFEDNAFDQTALDVRGTAFFRDGEVVVSELPEPISDIQAQLRFQGQQVVLEETGLQLGEIELLAAGTVDLETGFDLTAQIPEIAIADVQVLTDIALPVDAAGTFQLETEITGAFDAPQISGRLASLQPLSVDKVTLAALTADFDLTQTQLNLRELSLVSADGGTILAAGQADLTDWSDPRFQLTADVDLPVDGLAQTYGAALPPDTAIGTLTATVEAAGDLEAQTAVAAWQLSESSFPAEGVVRLADNVVVLEGAQLRVEAGTVNANAIAQLDSGDWQATLSTESVPIEQFTTQAEGLLSGELDTAGNLYNFDLANIQAAGNIFVADALVRFSKGLPNLEAPLIERGDWATAFEWQGDRVAVETFTAPGIEADGVIGVDFSRPVPIGAFDLNVALQDFDLEPLNALATPTLQDYAQLQGLTSFNGQLTGTLDNPQLAGTAQLENLALNEIVFEQLSGPIDFSLADGGQADLQGQQERLQLAVSDQFWPTSFEARHREFTVSGYGEGRQLHAEVTQFPLDKLDIQPAARYGFGTLAGRVDARVDADLRDFANPVASGTVTVAQPALNPIDAEQMTARFRYANNTATLEQGELLLDESRFLLTGQAVLSPEVQYEGALTVAEGRIEDLVAVVEKIDLSAFGLRPEPQGSAADLATVPVGLPNPPFLDQLQAFVAFVEDLPEPTADTGIAALPPWEDLTGGFTGMIMASGRSLSLENLTADFNLQGEGWEWGPYTPSNQFLISGDLQQETLVLDSFLVNAGETVVDLSGRGSLDQLTGMLRVSNLPVELVQSIYPLPVAVAGDLNTVTTFSGSLANPTVVGTAAIEKTEVNGQPLAAVNTTFDYRNANLEFGAAVAIDANESPLTVDGTLAYALPFMTVQPPTQQIAVQAVVPSDSFDLVNSLTADQVRWESGQGEVIVQVGGTLDTPVVSGRATLQEGVVSAQVLDDPLTDLRGEIEFDLERVDIQQLQAQLGEGQIEMEGQLPILPSGQSILAYGQTEQFLAQSQTKQAGRSVADRVADSVGLTIALDQLPIDYSGILQAVFNGQVLVTGAVLAPTLAGGVTLDEGVVKATELLQQAGAVSLPTEAQAEAQAEEINPYRAEYLGIDPLAPRRVERPKGILDNVRLQDFSIAFGDRLEIEGRPFYELRAGGSLWVNGPLTDLRPEGTIALESGWINLFSTQFRLDNNAPNTAIFTPQNGLDPVVDAAMVARVQETNFTRTPRSDNGFNGAEVNDTTNIETLGEVAYIRVRAIAQGPASELTDNLTLTSRPARSQENIIALLGTSVYDGLASGDLTQVAGFLGAGNVSNLGNDVADALGLRSFSIFPTTDTSTDSTVGIGIGIEAAFALGNNLEVNALEILNNGNPPQFGLQYRFNDQLQLRGSSNLDDTEVRLEYRVNF
ncbi:MAG: translocation/assembly module TamB domain-containing protein [Cyanobacteria bacterium P01_G01_bin.38]